MNYIFALIYNEHLFFGFFYINSYGARSLVIKYRPIDLHDGFHLELEAIYNFVSPVRHVINCKDYNALYVGKLHRVLEELLCLLKALVHLLTIGGRNFKIFLTSRCLSFAPGINYCPRCLYLFPPQNLKCQ